MALESLPRLERSSALKPPTAAQLARTSSAPGLASPGKRRRAPPWSSAVPKDRVGSPGPRKVLRHVDLRVDDDKYLPFPRMAFPKLEMKGGRGDRAKHEVDNIWSVALIDHEVAREERAAVAHEHFLAQFRMGETARPPSPSKGKGKSALTRQETPRLLNREPDDLRLGGEEALRLAALEAEFRTKKAKNMTQHMKRQMKVYEHENKKLRKALRQGRGGVVKQDRMLRVKAMDDLVELEREQQQAAVRIQKSYKTYRRKCFWMEYVYKSRAAVKIQRLAKGMVVRKMVRLWLARRWYLVTQVQSFVRGVQDRARARRMFVYEGWAAVDIQRIFRGYLARQRVMRRIAKRAARKIQALWRGAKVRAKLDRQWIDSQVIKIQAGILRFLSYKKFKEDWPRANAAATLIQRIFRGASTRMRRNDLLWEREHENRKLHMRVLRVEEVWISKEIQTMKKSRRKDNLDGKLPPLRKAWQDSIEEVRKFEYDLVALQRERMKMSPRAVEQGWTDELDKNVEQHRVWATDAKLKALFQVALPLRLMEEEKEKSDRDFADLQYKREQLDEWWRQDRDDMWARDSERKWALFKENRRKNIASQRRKWAFDFYTDTGKPDLSRPKGYPWKPDDFPERQTATFNSGGVELRVVGPDFVGRPVLRRGAVGVAANEEFFNGGPKEVVKRLADGTSLPNMEQKKHLRAGEAGYDDEFAEGGNPDDDGNTPPGGGPGGAPKPGGGGPKGGGDGGPKGPGGGGGGGAIHKIGETESRTQMAPRPVMEVPGEVGAVAAAQAAARAAIAIGREAPGGGLQLTKAGVMTVKQEMNAAMERELKEADAEGAEVDRLLTKGAAHSAVAQMVQYGALLKPIMDTMHKVQRTVNMADAALQMEKQEDAERRDADIEAAVDGVKVEKGLTEHQRMQKRIADAEAAKARGEYDEMAAIEAGLLEQEAEEDGAAATKGAHRKRKKKVKPPLTREVLERRAAAIRRSRIPWTMLDELEVEKRKLAFEKAKKLPFEKKRFTGDESECACSARLVAVAG